MEPLDNQNLILNSEFLILCEKSEKFIEKNVSDNIMEISNFSEKSGNFSEKSVLVDNNETLVTKSEISNLCEKSENFGEKPVSDNIPLLENSNSCEKGENLVEKGENGLSETLDLENNKKNTNSVAKNENLVPKIESLKPLLSDLTKTYSGTDKDCSGGEEETSSKRKRRKSRWDSDNTSEKNCKKRKSRWEDNNNTSLVAQIPDFLTNFGVGLEFDAEIQVLNSRLVEINRKLLSNLPLDDRPEGARSPSPEPVYDTKGIRINTRENRARDKLSREKQEIIQQMIKKNPNFRPPADYRPPKVQKKLYIPMKEYPGYNFIGLIIGPRGNTQKRMEKETGAKIVIRGKGSVKEGRLGQKRDLKFDPAENEDLHVLVEADTQEAVDAAAGMVEKLLQPVDEVLNEHKRQQLRELAALNGTIKDEEFCRLCGEQGHRQFACPLRLSTFKSDVLCKICGDGGHPTIDCPVKGTTGKKMDDEYKNFLAELGGTIPEGLVKQNSATLAIGAGNDNIAESSGEKKEYDETNLYIGYLPPTLEDDGLIRLFSPFGTIVSAKVVKDKVTGLSKGYGFVKYSDVEQANTAITSMNGQRIDNRTIAARVAGKPPPPVAPPTLIAPPASTPIQPVSTYTIPTYPVPNQPVSAYTVPNQPVSAYTVPNQPVSAYTVPNQPVSAYTVPSYTVANNYASVPPPYGTYTAPPPPGSTLYTPYGVQYPTPVIVTSSATSQVVSGEATQCPPVVQSQSSVSIPPLYTTPSSCTYAPYYGVTSQPPPPPPQLVTQPVVESFANVPWALNPLPPPPPPETTPGKDAEFEKFMTEMK